jgi:hypothetical protein
MAGYAFIFSINKFVKLRIETVTRIFDTFISMLQKSDLQDTVLNQILYYNMHCTL